MDDPTIIEMRSNETLIQNLDSKDNELMALWIQDFLMELDDRLTNTLKE